MINLVAIIYFFVAVSENFGKFYLVKDRYVYLRIVFLLDTIGWLELVISLVSKTFLFHLL